MSDPLPDPWLARHRRTVLVALVALSIVLRAIYFGQLNATPFIQLQQWRQTDMHYYDSWARTIAGGDWRSATVRLPMHRWHHDVAARYFVAHPDAKSSLIRGAAPGIADPDADEVLWSHWMRLPQFYQDPLYAYLIAASHLFIGSDPRPVLIAQLAIGVMTNVLLWSLARRYFGDDVAACTAALAVTCGPLMFYELLLLRDSLIAAAGLAAIWLAHRAEDGPGWIWSVILGAVLGAAVLLKGTFVLLAAVVIIGIAIRTRRAGTTRVAALTLGLGVVLAPVMVRNVSLGVAPLALASSGPLTFVASNDVSSQADVGFGINAPLLADFLGTTDGGWRAAVTRTLASHTAGSYAALAWRKWDRVWHWFEIPNNENFYYLRQQAPVLAWLPITFWTVGPLALVGLFVAAPRRQEVWPLYALAATTAVPLILFYVLGRFRVAFLAAVLPFAALALVESARAVAARRFGRAVVLIAGMVLAWSWCGRPLAAEQRLIRTSDWILAWSVTYESRVYGALDAHDPSRAAAAYQEFFLRYEPTDAQVGGARDPQLAAELADMHRECAQILRLAGDGVRAAEQERDAERLLRLSGG